MFNDKNHLSATEHTAVDGKRRSLIKTASLAAGASMLGLSTGGVWAAGSDKPEKEEVKIGFIPLTDCASVVMASVLGFDKKYGIKIVLSKESSWAGIIYATTCNANRALKSNSGCTS